MLNFMQVSERERGGGGVKGMTNATENKHAGTYKHIYCVFFIGEGHTQAHIHTHSATLPLRHPLPNIKAPFM